MGELLIRAGYNDHEEIGSLLTPGAATALRPPPIQRLVADVQIAAQRPVLADDAERASIPYLVDPLTPFLQAEIDPASTWVRKVDFGVSEALLVSDFSDARISQVVATVVETQVTLGATAIIPPYLFADSPDDPLFAVSLRMLQATARYMRHNDVNLPLVPLFCGNRSSFCDPTKWNRGIDRFIAAAADLGPQSLAVCFSPLGDAKTSYKTAMLALGAMGRFTATGIPVLAWRQGMLGPTMVAAGAAGYECGIGVRERANVRGDITSAKPKPKKDRSGGPPPKMIYIEGLGRSVKTDIAAALLGDVRMRAELLCEDEHCCPHSVTSMLTNYKRHTVLSRARRLEAMNQMPRDTWRLHQVAKDAQRAVLKTQQAEKVLRGAGIKTELSTRAQESIAQAANYLRQQAERRTA